MPTLNAALNAACAALLVAGYFLIRSGRREAHRRVMLAALATSGAFLVSYLTYHFQVGSVRFTGQGPVRTLYFAILISHTILAAAIVPLVLVTVARARGARFEAHRQAGADHAAAVALCLSNGRGRLLDAVPDDVLVGLRRLRLLLLGRLGRLRVLAGFRGGRF